MKTRTNRNRIAVLTAVGALAAGAYVATADAQQQPQVTPAVATADLSGIAQWADDHGYTGLSPASLGLTTSAEPAIASVDLSAIAEWADTNGYAGGSPTDLRPIDE